MRPLFSICIPAYNRASLLDGLLESIQQQDFENYEIVIAEDNSPERKEIREVCTRHNLTSAKGVRYYENEQNLGFDGNIRELCKLAQGEYVLFMGNDDILAKGALRTISNAIERHGPVGTVIRTYASFRDSIEDVDQVYRYFTGYRFFKPGIETVATVYRRSVVISGVVVHRDTAVGVATAEFDGTLLYQLYIVALAAHKFGAISVPDIVAYYRLGGTPDFGAAKVERGRFSPQKQTPESSIHFIRGMIEIASALERQLGPPLASEIRSDIANYSYPLLSIQSGLVRREFVKYAHSVSSLGLGQHPMYWIYFVCLLILGKSVSDKFIGLIKNVIGSTPVLGRVSAGRRL